MSHLVSPAKKGEQIDRRGLTDLPSDPPQEHTYDTYIRLRVAYAFICLLHFNDTRV